MSATKEVKALLDELRRQLDPDLAPHLEPVLRQILDASKPKTITAVEYRPDPRDHAEIESLRATIHTKDETIHKLQNKLADQPPPKVVHPARTPDHLTFKQRLDEWDKRAKGWIDWSRQCMELMADDEGDLRRRKQLLVMMMGMLSYGMCNYLSLMEGLRHKLPRPELAKLPAIVNKSAVEWLSRLEEDVQTATGVKVDLELFLAGQRPLFADFLPPGAAPPQPPTPPREDG
ncbi:MAG TPA: hypothetical protein VG125_19285 [Pirellulales bacterium]|jgi:hypothetical protein|nr:hypothetical protein [Pirellulales bacterium]